MSSAKQRPREDAAFPLSQRPHYLPSMGALSPEVIARAFFSTTSGDSMRNHFSDSKMEMARTSSYHSVLQPRQYTVSQVPSGMTRSMCTYHSDFVRQPLDACGPTNGLREVFKSQASQGSSAGPNAPKPPLSSVTTARSSYAAPRRSASGPVQSFKPPHDIHVNPEAKFMVSRSCFHREFKNFGSRRNASVKPPSDSKMAPPLCPDREVAFSGSTQYSRDYVKHAVQEKVVRS
eukprot:TRINITY_DN77840_c0_g1_i1.p1 TRINITY_DN77840_c0_g1~~TRINITY_DN77840_c0_g1_i1.p1  ORF type:complete len:246 (+),score=26.61 TRINITY_DN77840_c0_g1_i1:41-739(+)